jgi:DNA-binding NarL/FixJ family response regulator
MQKIRIILANYPQMMRALMREVIERQPDMEIVGEIVDPLGLLLAARQTRAEAVIMTLKNSEDPGLISHLLAECPDVTILGLASQGDNAFIVQMCPRRSEIATLSVANILSALRQAIRSPCSSEDEVNERPLC